MTGFSSLKGIDVNEWGNILSTIVDATAVNSGCNETPHRPHRPQIRRYLTL